MSTEGGIRAEFALAYLVAPVKPKNNLIDKDYPKAAMLFHDIKGVGNAQAFLDRAVENGQTVRNEYGVRTKIMYWDGVRAVVAGFNPEGIQMGYGQAIWDRDPRGRESTEEMMTFYPDYVVSSHFEGHRLGFDMMRHLEDFIALNNTGRGAKFFYDIQAETPERQMAAARMIEKIGAIRSGRSENDFLRVAVKPKYFRSGAPGITKLPEKVPVYIKY